MTQEQQEQLAQLTQQVQWLGMQIANLYSRLQLPYAVATDAATSTTQRTETGMGAILSPDKSSYI